MDNSWILEGKITIKYHWQENQGMHGAHNTAYELIEAKINIYIVSDDYMPDDVVESPDFWTREILNTSTEHNNTLKVLQEKVYDTIYSNFAF